MIAIPYDPREAAFARQGPPGGGGVMGPMGGGGGMPPPQQGMPQGAPQPPGAGGGEGMSPGFEMAVQGIMQLQSPEEFAVIGQVLMEQGEKVMGGGQGPPGQSAAWPFRS